MMKSPQVEKDHFINGAHWQDVDRALKRFGYQQDALIEVLHIAQETFGYLPPPVLKHIAKQLKLPESWVYGVASFYHFFSFQKEPKYTCVVCTGTACYVEGAQEIIKLLETEMGIKVGETTADGRFQLVDFRCPGSCGLAPILVLNGEMIGRETPQTVMEKVKILLGDDTKEVMDS